MFHVFLVIISIRRYLVDGIEFSLLRFCNYFRFSRNCWLNKQFRGFIVYLLEVGLQDYHELGLLLVSQMSYISLREIAWSLLRSGTVEVAGQRVV